MTSVQTLGLMIRLIDMSQCRMVYFKAGAEMDGGVTDLAEITPNIRSRAGLLPHSHFLWRAANRSQRAWQDGWQQEVGREVLRQEKFKWVNFDSEVWKKPHVLYFHPSQNNYCFWVQAMLSSREKLLNMPDQKKVKRRGSTSEGTNTTQNER